MDETTEPVTSVHASRLILADGSQPSLLERRLQPERPVRSMTVVVLGVDPKDLLKVGAPENDKPVQALGAHRPDPALGVWPWVPGPASSAPGHPPSGPRRRSCERTSRPDRGASAGGYSQVAGRHPTHRHIVEPLSDSAGEGTAKPTPDFFIRRN